MCLSSTALSTVALNYRTIESTRALNNHFCKVIKLAVYHCLNNSSCSYCAARAHHTGNDDRLSGLKGTVAQCIAYNILEHLSKIIQLLLTDPTKSFYIPLNYVVLYNSGLTYIVTTSFLRST